MERWQKAQAGDAGAFRELVEEIWPALYRLLYRYLENPATAEDVAQETLVRVWQRLDTFRGDSHFRTWVFAIGINLARNERRRQRSVSPQALSDSPTVDPLRVEDIVIQRERARQLTAALSRLPPTWRVALECVVMQGLSYEETAKILGTRPASVKNWIHRARVRLRALMNQWDNGGDVVESVR